MQYYNTLSDIEYCIYENYTTPVMACKLHDK